MASPNAIPPHPGQRLAREIERRRLPVTGAAQQIGVTRIALSRLIHGHVGVSTEMARRLEAWLGTPAKEWLVAQMDFDLAISHRAVKIHVKPCPAVPAWE